ncbi:MAG: ATP-binding protein [Pseudomonadota bacterium]
MNGPALSTVLRTVTIFLLLVGATWLSFQPISRFFTDRLIVENGSTLRLVQSGLSGTLKRFAPLPEVLADRVDVKLLLRTPETVPLAEQVGSRLAEIARMTGASDIYVMDRNGLTIASSNARDAVSFLGKNFSYRPYFTEALEGRAARYFALGTTSGKRGYYFSAPVRDGDRITGAIAIKIGVERLEANWRNADTRVMVSDTAGIIFMASAPDWHFLTLDPLDADAIDTIRQARRYPIERLSTTPLRRREAGSPGVSFLEVEANEETRTFLANAAFMADADWTVHVLVPRSRATGNSLLVTALVFLLLSILMLISGLIWQRRTQLIQRLALQRQTQEDLEARVALRTADLHDANTRLKAEIDERVRAEAQLRSTQKELVQAGKLAALGQMSAALSHELNQPLAAIKSFADNARAYLKRGKTEKTDANIGRISEMTDRMSELAGHLRNFARKPKEKFDFIRVSEVLEATQTIMSARLRREGAMLSVEPFDPDLQVRGGLVRLQQVMVNLVGNALDSLSGHSDRRIDIAVSAREDRVFITVRDRGPGIAPAILPQIFDPFFTTKDVNEGLGLGLSISFNIVQDFGGTLTVHNHPDGGAVFTVDLVEAGVLGKAAE